MKVGSKQYVMRALLSGKYDMLVVNTEASAAIALEEGIELADRLSYRGNKASILSGAECEERAADTIVRVLSDEPPLGWMDLALASARAGSRAALESIAVCLLGDLVHAVWSGKAVDLGQTVRKSVAAAGRSAARATLQSFLLVQQFVARAGRQFSDRLLHRIALSSVFLGAVADVVVETAIDVVRVLRREMSFEELLRDFGVHVCTAAGGALGLAIASALTGGAAWWVQGLAMLIGGALGAHAGRRLGTELFRPALLPLSSQSLQGR